MPSQETRFNHLTVYARAPAFLSCVYLFSVLLSHFLRSDRIRNVLTHHRHKSEYTIHITHVYCKAHRLRTATARSAVWECIFSILLSHSLSSSLSWFLFSIAVACLQSVPVRCISILSSSTLFLLFFLLSSTLALLSKTVWNQLFVLNFYFSPLSFSTLSGTLSDRIQSVECWSDSHVCIGYERWMRTKSIASRHFRHYYYLAIRTRCNIGGDQEPSHTRRCSHNRLWWNVMARPVVRDELGRQRRNSSGNIFTGVFMPLCAASFIDCLRGNHGKNV